MTHQAVKPQTRLLMHFCQVLWAENTTQQPVLLHLQSQSSNYRPETITRGWLSTKPEQKHLHEGRHIRKQSLSNHVFPHAWQVNLHIRASIKLNMYRFIVSLNYITVTVTLVRRRVQDRYSWLLNVQTNETECLYPLGGSEGRERGRHIQDHLGDPHTDSLLGTCCSAGHRRLCRLHSSLP